MVWGDSHIFTASVILLLEVMLSPVNPYRKVAVRVSSRSKIILSKVDLKECSRNYHYQLTIVWARFGPPQPYHKSITMRKMDSFLIFLSKDDRWCLICSGVAINYVTCQWEMLSLSSIISLCISRVAAYKGFSKYDVHLVNESLFWLNLITFTLFLPIGEPIVLLTPPTRRYIPLAKNDLVSSRLLIVPRWDLG